MKKDKKYFIIAILVALLLPLLTYVSMPFYESAQLVVDTGATVYAWQLVNTSIFTIITLIVLMSAHLIFNIYYVTKKRKEKTKVFDKYNLILLFGNLAFILMHQLQTNIQYDGLAKVTPVFLSQGSVIFMLVIILLMLNNKRGFIFNYKLKILGTEQKFYNIVHGILFLVALIFTFWFHPMVYTIGHYTGFAYMFLFFVQVSFMGTKYHYNKYWIVLLEVAVTLHAIAIAYFVQNSELWSMFLFGFLFIFFATQINMLRKFDKYNIMLFVGYLIVAFIYYFVNDNIGMVHQILWIPIIEYGIAIVIHLIVKLCLKRKEEL